MHQRRNAGRCWGVVTVNRTIPGRYDGPRIHNSAAVAWGDNNRLGVINPTAGSHSARAFNDTPCVLVPRITLTVAFREQAIPVYSDLRAGDEEDESIVDATGEVIDSRVEGTGRRVIGQMQVCSLKTLYDSPLSHRGN